MAIFNPNPTEVQDPYYLHLSKPIEQPKPNTATGEALKDIGDIGGNAIKVAHTLVQGGIQDEEYKRLNQVREDFTKGLDTVYSSVTGQGGPQTRVTDASLDVMTTPSAGAAMPKALESVPQTLESLEAARASGKYSQTFLDMKYDTVLKDLRSRYPGWKAYIDEEAKKVTGRDPANDYIKSKIGDINSWVAAATANKDKTLNKLYSILEHVPGTPVMIEGLKSGKVSEFVANSFINDNGRLEYDVKQQKLLLDKYNNDRSYQSTQAEDIATKTVSQAVTNHLTVLHASTGLGDDPVKLAETMERLSQDPAQARLLGQQIEAGAVGIHAQMVAKLKIPDVKLGDKMTSIWDILGADKSNKLINDNLSPVKDYATFIANKDYGPAIFLAEQNKGLENKALNSLYKNPTSAGIMLALHGINHAAGSAAVASMASISMLQDLPGITKAVVNADILGITAGTPDPTTGKLRTMNDTAATIQRARATEPLFGSPKVMNSYINTLEKIASKDPTFADSQKASWLHFMFGSSEGQNWLAKIEREGIDPNTGKPTNNQYSIYKRVLDPKIIGEAKRIGGQAWEDTKNWAENTFGNQLLKPDVMMMKDITIDPRLSFQWNDRDGQFRVVNPKGEDMLLKGPRPASEGPSVSAFEQATLNRINSGLRNLGVVAKTDGKDVSEYLAQKLIEFGFDPTAPNNRAGVQGIPDHMIRAITAGKLKQKLEEEEKQKAYKK